MMDAAALWSRRAQQVRHSVPPLEKSRPRCAVPKRESALHQEHVHTLFTQKQEREGTETRRAANQRRRGAGTTEEEEEGPGLFTV